MILTKFLVTPFCSAKDFSVYNVTDFYTSELGIPKNAVHINIESDVAKFLSGSLAKRGFKYLNIPVEV